MTLPAEFSAGCHIAIVITLVIMVINIVIIMVISMVLSMIIIMVLLMVIIIMVIIIMVIIIMVIIMVTIIMVILIIFIADYTGFPTLGLFSISRHPNYLAEQVLIILKIYPEWTFISAAVGGLLPLLSGRQGPLVKPLNHRLRSPHPTLPGKDFGHVSNQL